MKTKTKLADLIKERKFDWVNSDIIEEHFPLSEVRSDDYKVYHFDRYISSEDATKEMEKEGYLQANIHELLVWKGWNEKDYVIALGSVGKVRGGRRVPYLYGGGSERGLGLHWWGGDWVSDCRFLAVRNLDLKSFDTRDTLGSSEPLSLESAIAKVKKAGYKVIKEF